MLTLEQAIDNLMDVSRSIAEVAESESDEANRINAQNSADDCKQLAEWLRELKERRKVPEIIRCKGCKHYEWMSNRIPEEQTWHCHCWDADTGKDDFCSYAERRSK